CNVGGLPGHDNYAPCSADDLAARAIDYWALGHIHKRQDISSREAKIHYPGNTQARRFDERGAKGATLVHVRALDQVELEFLPLDEIRFAHVAVDANGCESLDQVLGVCEQKITAIAFENDGRFVLARIEITGQTASHATLVQAAVAEDEGLLLA